MTLQPLDDTAIYDIYISSRASACLAVGVRLGLFAGLEERPAHASEVAERFGVSARGADALLVSLHALRLLVRDERGYRPTPEAVEYLVPGRPKSLCGLIELEFDAFLSPERLLRSVQSGEGAVYDGDEVWGAHDADPERAARFTKAMHSISARPAAALAQSIDFSNSRCVLEVGGGSGVYLMELLRSHRHLRAVLMDLPEVCKQTGLRIEQVHAESPEVGFLDRLDLAPGDMFRDQLPGSPDVILFSQILHDWSLEQGRELLASAFDALPSGGRVLVHEKLLNDERSGPPANALVTLDMLFWTEGQQLTFGEVRTMMSDVGFREPRLQPTVGYWSVVEAWK